MVARLAGLAKVTFVGPAACDHPSHCYAGALWEELALDEKTFEDFLDSRIIGIEVSSLKKRFAAGIMQRKNRQLAFGATDICG